MTVDTVMARLANVGIRLAANGGTLRVEAPAGVWTPALRAEVVDHKAEILPLVAMRDRMLLLAQSIGVPEEIVVELPAPELQATIEQWPLWDDDALRARVLTFYLRALAGLERRAGYQGDSWRRGLTASELARIRKAKA